MRIDGNDALGCGFQQQPQLAVVLLVAPRLNGLLRSAALGHVQFKAGEPRDLASGITIGSTEGLHPQNRSIRPHIPVGVIPRIFPLQNLLQGEEHLRSVFGVNPPEQGLEQRRFVNGKPKLGAEGLVPIRVVGAGIPGP